MLVRLRGSRRDCVLSDADAFLMRMSEYGDDVGSGLSDDDICRRSRRLGSFLTRLVDRSPALSAGCRRASKVKDWPWEDIVGDTRGAAFRFSNEELECEGKWGGDVCNAGGRRMVGLESNFWSRLQNCVAIIVVKQTNL